MNAREKTGLGGTGQTQRPAGATERLTVAKYESPSGKKIEDEAVTPNIAVSQNPAVLAEDESTPQEPRPDEQLNKALEILKQKNA